MQPLPDINILTDILDLGVENKYNVYQIRSKKSAKLRTIEEPDEELKGIQKHILQTLSKKITFHSACMAQAGRSIADNAAHHEGSKYILRVDIKSCYPSITRALVHQGLATVTNSEHDFAQTLRLARFCMYNDRLPTGAPTSPFLCNVALTPLDYDLDFYAKAIGYKYTRYIDDIHFSTKNPKRDWNIIDRIYDYLEHYNLKPNTKKTRWQTNTPSENLIVTGVRIGTTQKVPRKFRRKIRAKLNNLAVKGLDIDAETRGCLAYIKSIDSSKYNSLLAYYERRKTYGATLRECASP